MQKKSKTPVLVYQSLVCVCVCVHVLWSEVWRKKEGRLEQPTTHSKAKAYGGGDRDIWFTRVKHYKVGHTTSLYNTPLSLAHLSSEELGEC